MASGKRKRKSRKSLGREGHPHRVGKAQGVTRLLNQLKAHQAGKRTMVTIDNPVSSQTNMRKIRVLGDYLFRDKSKEYNAG